MRAVSRGIGDTIVVIVKNILEISVIEPGQAVRQGIYLQGIGSSIFSWEKLEFGVNRTLHATCDIKPVQDVVCRSVQRYAARLCTKEQGSAKKSGKDAGGICIQRVQV